MFGATNLKYNLLQFGMIFILEEKRLTYATL